MGDSIGGTIEDCLIALAAVAVAAIAATLLWPLTEAAPLAFFYVAVAVAARRGGLGPCLAAIIASALPGAYFFLPPYGSFQLTSRSTGGLFVFLGVSALIGWLTARRGEPRTTRRVFEKLVEHIAAGAALVDPVGRIGHLNPIAERLTGWSLAEARGKPVGEVFRLVDERTRAPRDPVAAVLAAGGAAEPPADSILISRNGVEVPVTEAAAPLWEAPDRLSGVAMLIHNTPQRRRLREALRQSEELNNKIIDNTDVCIKLLDLSGRILMINKHGARMLEIDDRDAWVGRPLAEGWPEETREAMRDAIRRAALGDRVHFTCIARTVKGARKWWEVSITPILDAGGKPEKLLTVGRDVTERKETEDALRASQERYRALFSSIDEGFCVEEVIFDNQGRPIDIRLLEANPAFEAITGLRGVVGRTFRELNSGVDEDWLKTHGRVATTGEPTRFCNLTPSANGRWYEVYAYRVDEDIHKVAFLFRDITESVLAERERERLARSLENERAQLTRLIENAPAFIAVVRGPNHVFELANEKYYEAVGRRGLIGRAAAEAVPELRDLGLIEELDRVYRTGEPFEAREMSGWFKPNEHGERSKRFANFVYQAMRDPDGSITGVFIHGVDITERKRVEDALRAGEERYRALFNSINEGFCVVEILFDDQGRPIDHRFLEVNPAFEYLTGLRGVVGRTMLEIAPQQANIWLDNIARVAFTGEPARFANREPTVNDKWFDLYVFRLGGDDSRVVATLFRDVTENVLAERERARLILSLENQRAELARLVQKAPAFIAIMRGPNHIVELANEKGYALVGRRVLLGRPVAETVPEAARQGFIDLLDRVYRTGEAYIAKEAPFYADPKGNGELEKRVVNFVYQAMRDPDGSITGVFLHGVDVTDMVEAAEAVKESEARYRQLADAMPQAVWTVDPDGKVDFCNRSWLEYTGFQEKPVPEDAWSSVIHPDDLEHVKATWDRAIASGEPFESEFRFKRASDGAFRWHLSRALPIRNEHGQIVRWIGTNTDIDDFKRLSEALKETDRHKDEFLATLAHELRNPLAPIRTGLQILKMKPADDVFASTFEMMSRQLGHIIHLIDDLLDVARVGSGKVVLQKERVTLGSVIETALEANRQVIEAKHHELVVNIADEPIWLEADPTRLTQVVSNLLTNAAKYTKEGGRIEVSANQEDGDAVVRVKDTGEGIEAEMLTWIFEMFSQIGASSAHSQGGLGIGLTVVKRLVELHGGRIEARSEGLGRGSEFVVHLPLLANGEASENQATPEHGDEPENRLRVLVVDDNHDSADTLAKVVAMAGHHVRTAYDGERALSVVEAFQPGIVLLDIGLPGLNGYQVAERIRGNPAVRDAKLVAVTGWGQAEDRRRSSEAGFDLHFVKPVDLNLLQLLLKSGVDAVKRELGEPTWRGADRNGAGPEE